MSDVAFEAGKELELRTIHFIITELKRMDVAHRIMDDAAQKVWVGQDQWLRAVFAITGPPSFRLSAVQAVMANQARHYVLDPLNNILRFVVRAGGAGGERGIELVEVAWVRRNRQLVDTLMADKSTDERRPLHPFLVDTRTPTWAITEAFERWNNTPNDPYCRIRGPIPWAVRAAYESDVSLLEVLRDTPASARPRYNWWGYDLDPSAVNRLFSFEGAREAAVRTGNLAMLQWLFSEIDVPVEPTLLCEAEYYHQFEVAEWLVSNHPEACQETNWEDMVYVPLLSDCGLDNGLLESLETRESIRACLDFGPLIDSAARANDAASLRLLHKWYPELVLARPNLLELANRRVDEELKAVHVLEEIGYHSMENPELSEEAI